MALDGLKIYCFTFQKFNLIETYDYDERITCLHGNWGRLFVGLSDGVVSVRSMKVGLTYRRICI